VFTAVGFQGFEELKY